MIETGGFLLRARIDAQALETWIEAGWLCPRCEAHDRFFSEIDVARAQLIRDLTQELGINEDGVSVVLDLVDQIHGVRQALRDLLSAVAAQPEPVRRRIAAEMREASNRRR
jgi:chaperone modulatory protein CbpM